MMKKLTISAIVTALLALAALSGASVASAGTVICSENQTPCANGNIKPSGTEFGGFAMENEVSLSLSAVLNYQCKGGVYGAKTTGVVGNPLSATGVASNNPSYCSVKSNPSYSCNEMKVSQPPASISATKNGEGTVTYGTAGEHLSVKLTCSHALYGTWTCKWGSASVVFTFGKGEFGTKEAALSLEEKSGSNTEFFCPSTAKLTISTTELGGYIATA